MRILNVITCLDSVNYNTSFYYDVRVDTHYDERIRDLSNFNANFIIDSIFFGRHEFDNGAAHF